VVYFKVLLQLEAVQKIITTSVGMVSHSETKNQIHDLQNTKQEY